MIITHDEFTFHTDWRRHINTLNVRDLTFIDQNGNQFSPTEEAFIEHEEYGFSNIDFVRFAFKIRQNQLFESPVCDTPTSWKKLPSFSNEFDLPNVAPFDGKPVLIKTDTGIVEAWWFKGEYGTPTYEGETNDEPAEWVCYDDKFQVDFNNVIEWMPIPK